MNTEKFFEAFDERTQIKLTIFSKYIEAWIPTFVKRNFSDIHIYDFFAGAGKDNNNVIGSPLIILQAVLAQKDNILLADCNVHIHFNDKKTKIFEVLKTNCLDYFYSFPKSLQSKVILTFSCDDFENIYPKVIDKLSINRFTPSLFLIDPFGVFSISEYLEKVIPLEFNDFLIFMPSANIKRFYNTPSIHQKFPPLSFEEFEPYQVHQAIVEQLANYYQRPDNDFSLLPFTIQRDSNYYGIIFGAKHLLALDKFLTIAWQLDHKDGNANFSVNVEKKRSKPIQQELFAPLKLTKKESFENALAEKILLGEITNNFEAYEYCIRSGHPVSHAYTKIKELKRNKKITFDNPSPKVSYKYYKTKDKPEQTIHLVKYKII